MSSPSLSLWCLVVPFLAIVGCVTGGKFGINVSTDGSYSITVDENAWLISAPTFFRADGVMYTLEDKTLKLNRTEGSSGTDKIGLYQSTCYVFQAASHTITSCIKTYYKPALDLVIFQQIYTNGAKGTESANVDITIGGFPSFQLFDTVVELGYMSFGGTMFGAEVRYGPFIPAMVNITDGISGGPYVLFDHSDNVIITAPFSQFMAAEVTLDRSRLRVNWGVMGGVDTVPEGYTYETILYYGGKGINEAMADWGSFMRSYYDKDDSYRNSDLTLTHLGYWTDGGAYYYYNTEPGRNYEQTILDVYDYSKAVGLPYKYVQYDSFFYPKGPDGGVKTWVPMPELFPDGFYSVYEKTGWPAGAHNRWWSPSTTYAKQNGGQFDFIIDNKTGKAIPTEEKFWNYLFDSSRKWGLTLYEQDWLDVEFSGLYETLHDIDLGRSWLLQMGRAAQNNGLTIMYSMSNPRQGMQTLEIPVVTQARVSGDYRAGRDDWKIGPQSLFADAMGIAPFKDCFWSTKDQPGNPRYPDLQETHAELGAMVATLSTGSVAPGDMVNATNVSMLMQCCNSDGLILKPSKPAMAINSQMKMRALPSTPGPEGEIYTTYTRIGDFTFGIILAADMQANYSLTPETAGFSKFQPTVVFSRMTAGVTKVSSFGDRQLALVLDQRCSTSSPCLYYTSPVFSVGSSKTVVIYGEEGKFVPMSPQRVSDVDVVGDDIVVYLKGAAHEQVNFTFVEDASKLVRIHCLLGASGTAVVSLVNKSCTGS